MYFRAGENPKFWELKGHILGCYFYFNFCYDKYKYIFQALFHSMRSAWVPLGGGEKLAGLRLDGFCSLSD